MQVPTARETTEVTIAVQDLAGNIGRITKRIARAASVAELTRGAGHWCMLCSPIRRDTSREIGWISRGGGAMDVGRRADGRRIFSAEFKREQVGRLQRGEITPAELARELGVQPGLIRR